MMTTLRVDVRGAERMEAVMLMLCLLYAYLLHAHAHIHARRQQVKCVDSQSVAGTEKYATFCSVFLWCSK